MSAPVSPCPGPHGTAPLTLGEQFPVTGLVGHSSAAGICQRPSEISRWETHGRAAAADTKAAFLRGANAPRGRRAARLAPGLGTTHFVLPQPPFVGDAALAPGPSAPAPRTEPALHSPPAPQRRGRGGARLTPPPASARAPPARAASGPLSPPPPAPAPGPGPGCRGRAGGAEWGGGGCSSIAMATVTSSHPGSNWRKPRGPSRSPRANRACALPALAPAAARWPRIGCRGAGGRGRARRRGRDWPRGRGLSSG